MTWEPPLRCMRDRCVCDRFRTPIVRLSGLRGSTGRKDSGRKDSGQLRQAGRAARSLRLVPLLPGLAGCEGVQSALWPQGPAAAEIARVSWVMFIAASAILLLVMVLALYAIYRAPERRMPLSANFLIAAGGVGLPLVTLTALLGYGVYSMASLRAEPQAALEIDVVGHQWWWEMRYGGEGPEGFVTANEVRIPAGVPVRLRLHSRDVIHSFWVPNLAGKIDLIPGHVNHLVIQADQPGTFRGQCAEYCGAQHARMAFYVIAEAPESFAAWAEAQRAPAAEPQEGAALRGRELLRANACLDCHSVRGLGGTSGKGPDLTHLASRSHIAGGTLENNRANLERFIADSQALKPGNRMPSFPELSEQDVQAIAAYLEGLR